MDEDLKSLLAAFDVVYWRTVGCSNVKGSRCELASDLEDEWIEQKEGVRESQINRKGGVVCPSRDGDGEIDAAGRNSLAGFVDGRGDRCSEEDEKEPHVVQHCVSCHVRMERVCGLGGKDLIFEICARFRLS
jgi:hypothetical protein